VGDASERCDRSGELVRSRKRAFEWTSFLLEWQDAGCDIALRSRPWPYWDRRRRQTVRTASGKRNRMQDLGRLREAQEEVEVCTLHSPISGGQRVDNDGLRRARTELFFSMYAGMARFDAGAREKHG